MGAKLVSQNTATKSYLWVCRKTVSTSQIIELLELPARIILEILWSLCRWGNNYPDRPKKRDMWLVQLSTEGKIRTWMSVKGRAFHKHPSSPSTHNNIQLQPMYVGAESHYGLLDSYEVYTEMHFIAPRNIVLKCTHIFQYIICIDIHYLYLSVICEIYITF